MSEWKEIELGKCVNMISGGTPSKDNDDYWNGDISWASAKDLKSFLLHDTQDYITKIGSQNGTKIAPKGSILILVRGMTLHNDFPICCITKDMAFNQDIKAVIPDNSLINTEYLAYWMLSSKYHLMSLVESASHGTGRINTSVLKSIKVSCPTLEEQRSIAKILGNFDRKIDNLRRQNETLEEIARSIFKHWFIDFEFPNADGKPYKSSGGAMVRSDLGDIPKGWRLGNIKDIMTLNYGKSLIAETRIKGKYPVIGSNGIVDTHNDFFVTAPGIVIGRKGTIGKVIWIEKDFYPIDTTFYIQDILGCNGLYFHYFILKNQNFSRLTSDSAVPGLNRDMAYSVDLVIPIIERINEYNSIAETIFNKVSNNSNQIQTLTKTRDALLPKLMSGQLRVNE
jgi:type I restriction enzyme, S subunit